jgi:4-amino-4-deoxy-L-arabinose transferase-like glycosyltransferase
MSTPSITAPARASLGAGAGAGRRAAAARLLVGREDEPAWSRPLLWIVAVLAGGLGLWGLTRNGYANTYYAEAAQAASRNWTAWLTNALDTSGSVSLDKGPLANMVMGLSGRLFGFSSFSMLLPEALAGVASVLVLHNVVKRTMGHRAAILAALILAVTPIFVAMSRFNNPDALLVLCGLAAAWMLVRALETGRSGPLVLCAVFVGLAFNVKMLEAYLIVPGLAAAFLVAGRGSVRRRLAQLTVAGGAMTAVSFVWYGAMMLLPAADRPWVGDTTDNSWFTLIFGANGLSRVAGNTAGGPGGGGGFGGATGPLRMFNSIVGGQIAWLLPLAAAGLVLGLWTGRRAPREDRGRAAYLLWGGWALVSWAVFSFSQGIFHPYYTTLLAPAVAALAGGGLTEAWERTRSSVSWAAGLAAAVVASAVLAADLLGRAAGFVPWLAPATVGLSAAAAAGLVVARSRRVGGARRMAAGAAVLGTLALLAGPTAYSLATVGRPLTGSNPVAGPASAARDGGPGGGGAPGGRPPGGGTFARPAGAPAGLFGPPPGAGFAAGGAGRLGGPIGGADGAASKALVSYLEAHQGSARYLVAAVGSNTAAGLALQTGRQVIAMGGFMGSDPAPSLTRLEALVHSGQLHYVLLGGGGRPGGFGRQAATTARDAWVRQHGAAVSVGGQTVYYLATSA